MKRYISTGVMNSDEMGVQKSEKRSWNGVIHVQGSNRKGVVGKFKPSYGYRISAKEENNLRKRKPEEKILTKS